MYDPGSSLLLITGVGKAKLGVDNDASYIITHAYQPCPLHLPTVKL